MRNVVISVGPESKCTPICYVTWNLMVCDNNNNIGILGEFMIFAENF